MGGACDEAAVHVEPATGRFSVARSNYTDPAIFRAEMDRIFSKCWLYVGPHVRACPAGPVHHANVGGRSVIFLRDRDGTIRCFLNICPHRGAQVCRLREGKRAISAASIMAGHSRTPAAQSASPSWKPIRRTSTRGGRNDLVPVPRFEEYRGFWFLNFDRHAVSLADYLGKACDYIDVIVDPAEQGMHIVGGVQEYSARANWKLLAENSTDILHVETLHPTYLDLVNTNSGGKMVRGKMEGQSARPWPRPFRRRAARHIRAPDRSMDFALGRGGEGRDRRHLRAPDPEARRGARLPHGEVRAQSADFPQSRPERHHVRDGPNLSTNSA